MPARCQICTSPYLQQISDLVDSNTLTLKQIAVQFSVSVFFVEPSLCSPSQTSRAGLRSYQQRYPDMA